MSSWDRERKWPVWLQAGNRLCAHGSKELAMDLVGEYFDSALIENDHKACEVFDSLEPGDLNYELEMWLLCLSRPAKMESRASYAAKLKSAFAEAGRSPELLKGLC